MSLRWLLWCFIQCLGYKRSFLDSCFQGQFTRHLFHTYMSPMAVFPRMFLSQTNILIPTTLYPFIPPLTKPGKCSINLQYVPHSLVFLSRLTEICSYRKGIYTIQHSHGNWCELIHLTWLSGDLFTKLSQFFLFAETNKHLVETSSKTD